MRAQPPSRRTGWTNFLSVAAALLALTQQACETPQFSAFSTDPDVSRLVILPDTQCYAHRFEEVFAAQGQWLVDQHEALAIVAAVTTGDIVETNSDAEWEIARRAYAPVLEQMPVILLPGNHDFGDGGSANERTSRMASFFPAAERFPNAIGETFSEQGWNSWTLVELGRSRWLLLGLEFAPRQEVVDWAADVLSEQAYDHALVSTHAYQAPSGLRYGEEDASRQAFHPQEYGLFDQDSFDGQALWRALLEPSDRVRLMVSGHVPQGFDHRQVRRADDGQMVELLVDHQRGTACPQNGGDGQGFLQVLEVSEMGTQLSVRMVSYSPWLDAFREEHGASWTLPL